MLCAHVFSVKPILVARCPRPNPVLLTLLTFDLEIPSATTAASAQNRREDFPVDIAAAEDQGDAVAAHRLAFLNKGG